MSPASSTRGLRPCPGRRTRSVVVTSRPSRARATMSARRRRSPRRVSMSAARSGEVHAVWSISVRGARATGARRRSEAWPARDGGAHPVVDFLGLSAAQAVALGRQGRAERDDLAGFLLDFAHGSCDEGFTVFGLALGPGPVVVARAVNHEDFDVRGVDGLAGDGDARGVREAPDECARRANKSLGAGGWHRTHRDKGSRPRAPVPWWARHVTPVRAIHEAVQGTPGSAPTPRTRGQSRVPTAASRAATSSSSAVTSSAE